MASLKQQKFVIGCICLLMVATCITISFIWTVFARSSAKSLTINIDGIGQRIKADMIFAISNSDNHALVSGNPELYYITEWKGRFPGVDKGCVCPDNSVSKGVERNSGRFPCGGKQLDQGCKTIEERPPVDMPKFTTGQTIYVVRGKGTNFELTQKSMKPDGSCESGFTKCGPPNVFRGVCIDSRFTQCPITDISSSSKAGYTDVVFNGFTLSYSSSADGEPFVDAVIAQDHLCFLRFDNPFAPGRPKYELLKGANEPCIRDDTTIPLQDIGEVDFFDFNGVKYQDLYRYDPSNDFKYKLIAGRRIYIKPECREFVQEMRDTHERAISLSSNATTLFGLFIATLSVLGVTMCCGLYSFVLDITALHIIIAIVRLIVWIMSFVPVIICYVQADKLFRTFDRLAERHCSDDPTNRGFKEFADYQNSKTRGYYVIVLSLFVTGFFLDLLFYIFTIVFCREEGQTNGFKPAAVTAPKKIAMTTQDKPTTQQAPAQLVPPPLQALPPPPAPAQTVVVAPANNKDESSLLNVNVKHDL